jgi:hypothetical protein
MHAANLNKRNFMKSINNISIAQVTLVIGALIAVTGCATPPKPSITANFGGIRIYSTGADQQSSFLKQNNSGEYFCDSRASDVADTASNGIGLSASEFGSKEGISESHSRGAVALGGRSPAVLITREVMYRTCEIVMNLALDKKEALDLYIKTLNLVQSISKNDTNSGTSSISDSTSAQEIKMIDTTTPVSQKSIKDSVESKDDDSSDDDSSDDDSSDDDYSDDESD